MRTSELDGPPPPDPGPGGAVETFLVASPDDALVERVRARIADGTATRGDATAAEVEVARSTGQALRVLAPGRFHLVLLDLDGAGPDAGTVADVVAAAGDTPVIALSPDGDDGAGLQAVRDGATDYVPVGEIGAPGFVRAVRSALERGQRARAAGRFRAFIENSRDLLVILDRDFTIRYASPTLPRILGFEPGERRGLDVLAEIHPDDRPRVLEAFRRLLREPTYTARLRYRVRHRDGTWRILEALAENAMDDPGIGGLVVNSWDVTESTRTEEKLRAARRRLEVLQHVAATANEAERLRDALDRVIATLPPLLDWDVGHAYVEREGVFEALPTWFTREPSASRRFRTASRLTTFTPGAGMVGRAASTGAVQWMRDLARNPEFQRRSAAGSLERGLAIPVSAADEIVAVLELFSTRDEPLEPWLLESAKDIGIQLGRVAERERALEALEESRGFLQQLVDGIPDALFVKDLEGQYILINLAGAEFVGASPDQVIGRTDAQLFEPLSAVGVVRNDREVLRSGEALTETETITDKRGITRHYSVTKGPTRDAEGRVNGLFGIARDITELTRAKAALEERVKELRTLYGATRTLARAEIAIEERLAQLVHLLPPGWLHPEVTQARVNFRGATYATPRFTETPWMLTSPIMSGGEPVGEVTVALLEERPEQHFGPFLEEEQELLDVIALSIGEAADREKLEGEFVHAQKMEAVGRLTGGIAHDFNNLLTVIRAHTDFVLLDAEEGDPLVEEVEAIRGAADRAAELTSQLLAFSRDQMLRPRTASLNDVVVEVERLLARILGEDIRIVTDLEPELPAVEVDVAKLEQALLNLAVNARDAMPRGGTLRFTTRSVDSGDRVCVSVSDTGVGMDEATRQRVFDPFFTTKSRGQGTGLGLAMVHGFVAQSGGTITVESAPGEGTTFDIGLPSVDRSPEGDAGPGDPEPPAEGRRTGRVLVVEDDPSVRRAARRILGRSGFDCRVVEDAESALEVLEDAAGDFDLLLSDLVLPGLGGRDLLERVRRRWPELHVVIMSGYDASSPRDRTPLPPEVPFLQKPFTPDELVDSLVEALGSG